ncbi:MAG: bifunctional demethylmenaquinone methyltransferase/2-methoxy-6-polyprenyl-1,4-benzoquinol methylase UbiE [Alphaproteobacteria bacterium]|nr:bifunctional demethylmenaquinone methyltransferase/2-methoxy-6-polyprenyl-1,4-benzoquinol methylase UbiE [Alphaproteobacteria bacterium]
MQYHHDRIVPNLTSSLSKQKQITTMFDSIARRYDLLNFILSFGLDKSWRIKLIRMALKRNPDLILDVATGSADLAIMAAEMCDHVNIIGVDISKNMLDVGRQKIDLALLQDRIGLMLTHGVLLPFDDNYFDVVMIGFGIRNFEFLDESLQELRRVLKPNGRLLILEFTKNNTPILKYFINFYIKFVAPVLAFMVSGKFEAYSYLQKSIQEFPAHDNFNRILSGTGFREVKHFPLKFKICAIYSATK